MFAVLAVVSAVPFDETVAGQTYGQDDVVRAQDPNEFFKLKKIKKLLFG